MACQRSATRIFRLPFALCALIAFFGQEAWGFENAYWVWHRERALTGEETRALAAQDVRTLYWHAGTLKAVAGKAWKLEGTLQLPPASAVPGAPKMVPVLRLSIEKPAPLGEVAAESVCAILRSALQKTGASEVQLDFDCPDRRLEDYAAFLAKCRARLAPVRLSATALAGWSRLPAFDKLQAGVDALAPMFYDLVPDSPADLLAGRPLPILDAPVLAAQLASWQKRCRIPWFAGLPNFSRVSVFDLEGRSRGHLRAWDWDTLCINAALLFEAQPQAGVTVLRAASDVVVADTPIAKNETLVCRWPEPAQLGAAISASEKAGAAGVVFFRMPGVGQQSGWSLGQMETLLAKRSAGEPALTLRRTALGVELSNGSGSDLLPRFSKADGGWHLEIESGEANFREAGAGEFASVLGVVAPESAEQKSVHIQVAQRLRFQFADLRAQTSRQSGLLQMAPGAGPLRWRIPHSPKNSQWQTLP